MFDYYKILGIPRFSDLQQIRSAYRQLAFQYHPDKNPGNRAAEEYFKQVNTAHQTLSNPHKKAQYDLLLNYSYQISLNQYTKTKATTFSTSSPFEKYKRQWHERSIYNRYGRFDWRQAPQFKKAPSYKIDKDYFKIQLLTLLGVLVISIFIIGSVKVNHYFEEQKVAEIKAKNDLIISQAHQLYDQGHYRKAINIVSGLIDKYPIENQFTNEKEKMVAGISKRALSAYKKSDYQNALASLEVVRDYERPMKLSTWRMVADCYYELGQYKQAIHALDYILMRDKNNIELAIKIGNIYHKNLGMVYKALNYYTQAKYIFKETYSSTYGEAFELIMPAERTPLIYFNMFQKRGELNMKAKNYQEAITDFNWAIYLRPKMAEPYHFRGKCYHNTGDAVKACRDWHSSFYLGYISDQKLINTYCKSSTP